MKKLIFIIITILVSANLLADDTMKPQIDGNYSDWQSIPALAIFSEYYNPVYFMYQDEAGEESRNINKANYWNQSGTLLKEIRGAKSSDKIQIKLESQNSYTQGTLFYLYLFKERKAGTACEFTIEINPYDKDSQVYLWQKFADKPRVIGKFMASARAIELAIDLSEWPKDLLPLNDISFDLTSCFYSELNKNYEEFFFFTYYFADFYQF
ncbi:MAG: hypothetical protein JXR70_12925 [Spirochaetales bacterium]|nr:hypothetical protein [Spirochaetales bacterium]